MKLAVSNIAWDNTQIEKHLVLLKDLNCNGIEIAPSTIWKEPTKISDDELTGFKNLIAYNW